MGQWLCGADYVEGIWILSSLVIFKIPWYPQVSWASRASLHLLITISWAEWKHQALKLESHCLCHSPHPFSYLNRSNWRYEEQQSGAAFHRHEAVSSWLAPFDNTLLISCVPELIKWKIMFLFCRLGTRGLRDGHHWWNLSDTAKSKCNKSYICFQWPQDPRCHWQPRARVFLLYFSTITK